MWISHRKEIRKLTFRAQALRRSESRNCGLCEVYIQKYGATLLVGAWTLEQKFIFQIGTLNPDGINERFSFN